VTCGEQRARWKSRSRSVNRAHPVNDYLSYADLHIETAAKRETAAVAQTHRQQRQRWFDMGRR
jgi:hypothetical protein